MKNNERLTPMEVKYTLERMMEEKGAKGVVVEMDDEIIADMEEDGYNGIYFGGTYDYAWEEFFPWTTEECQKVVNQVYAEYTETPETTETETTENTTTEQEDKNMTNLEAMDYMLNKLPDGYMIDTEVEEDAEGNEAMVMAHVFKDVTEDSAWGEGTHLMDIAPGQLTNTPEELDKAVELILYLGSIINAPVQRVVTDDNRKAFADRLNSMMGGRFTATYEATIDDDTFDTYITITRHSDDDSMTFKCLCPLDDEAFDKLFPAIKADCNDYFKYHVVKAPVVVTAQETTTPEAPKAEEVTAEQAQETTEQAQDNTVAIPEKYRDLQKFAKELADKGYNVGKRNAAHDVLKANVLKALAEGPSETPKAPKTKAPKKADKTPKTKAEKKAETPKETVKDETPKDETKKTVDTMNRKELQAYGKELKAQHYVVGKLNAKTEEIRANIKKALKDGPCEKVLDTPETSKTAKAPKAKAPKAKAPKKNPDKTMKLTDDVLLTLAEQEVKDTVIRETKRDDGYEAMGAKASTENKKLKSVDTSKVNSTGTKSGEDFKKAAKDAQANGQSFEEFKLEQKAKLQKAQAEAKKRHDEKVAEEKAKKEAEKAAKAQKEAC